MFQAITEHLVAKRQINLEGAYSPPTHRSAKASERTNQFGEAGLCRFFRVQMRMITVPLPTTERNAITPRVTVSQMSDGSSSIVVLILVDELEFKKVFFVVCSWSWGKAMVGTKKHFLYPFSLLYAFRQAVENTI